MTWSHHINNSLVRVSLGVKPWLF